MTDTPLEKPILSISVPLSAAVEPHRFCSLAGDYPAAGAWAPGITRFKGSSGDLGSVDVAGILRVELAEAVAAVGTLLESDADGKAKAQAGAGIGLCRNIDTGVAGDVVRVLHGITCR